MSSPLKSYVNTLTYRQEMLRTTNDNSRSLTHAALGIGGEAGEVVDVLKKHLMYGVPLDRAHLLEELGDLRWYMELALHEVGSTIEEIERMNVDKLNKRYPEAK